MSMQDIEKYIENTTQEQKKMLEEGEFYKADIIAQQIEKLKQQAPGFICESCE